MAEPGLAQGPKIITVGGPFFEDLRVGQVFDDAPPVTIGSGHTALHQALTGDRLRLALDGDLSTVVTGERAPLVHPNLVCDIAIGQSTGASQRVLGNLFYRGLVLLRPVFVGDTLHTTTEVVGLRQNRSREGRRASGVVALRIRTANQRGDPVLDFWRCPMLPLRNQELLTGYADSFDAIPTELDPARVAMAVPDHWRLGYFRDAVSGPGFADLASATTWRVEGRDTVTGAPELVRLSLNLAYAHSDAGASTYDRRLVYGGHTISLAAAHVTRALPNLVSILAWQSCEHIGPVFEGDILGSTVTLVDKRPLEDGGLVDLQVAVEAEHEGGDCQQVLDWRLIGLMA
jgi:2-methylfumaryl-CoA hydratase